MSKLSIACLFLCILLVLTNCNKDDKYDKGSNPSVITKPVAVNFIVMADSISVNPNGYTPLSAQVTFYSVNSGRTFIRVHGRHGALTDVTHLFSDTGTFHSIPVIGMYADTANTVDIRIVDNDNDTVAQSTVTIVTQALPSLLPTSIVASVPDESKVAPGMYLVSNFTSYGGTSGKPYIPYMMDAYGDIRWVLDYSSNTELSNMYYEDGIARLKNGNFYFGNSINNIIYEVDILGNVLNRWTMPGYLFHHEVHEETNGNFILNATKTGSTFRDGSTSIEDYVIEIDRNSKQITTVWDLKQSLNEYRQTWTGGITQDWFHGNAVFDDSTDNTIIVSGREQGVVKLDRSNHVKWILAPHKDWGINGNGDSLNKYLLSPLDASGNVITDTTVAYGSTITPDFEWNCYQHSPIQLPNGDLMVFDNGTSRTLDPVDGNKILNGAPGKYSRAAEFKIDPVKMTVQQIWEYGKERDVACYSSIVGSVEFLPGSNHVVFAPGAFVQNDNGKGGKIIEVDYSTKEVVNEIDITTDNTFSHHRAKKISVYPDNL